MINYPKTSTKQIDVCPNFCMLYYNDNALKIRCDVCKEPRYEEATPNKKAKPVPRKILCYLPITPRLQRMYMTQSTVEYMRWHKEGVRQKIGLMVYPVDAEDWKKFDQEHPDFASEVRNI